MKHLTTAALCLKLQAPAIMDRAFAAEELGRRGAVEALGALCGALITVTSDAARGIDAAPFVIKALAQIGDARAGRAILEVLRRTAGTFLLPELEPLSAVACRALVTLRATAMLPALRELQRGRTGALFRDLVARTIAKLGGADEAPFFLELLGHPHPTVRAAACSALGVLRYQPAAPLLEELRQSQDKDVRWAALGACIALGQPGAVAAFREEARRLDTVERKIDLLWLPLDHELTELAGVLYELAGDPRWICSPTILFYTLETALQLGSAPARAQLAAIEADEQASPCARARAAGILLARSGEVEMTARCFTFLRECTDPAKRDPRDDRFRRCSTQLEVIEALERFGRDFPEHRGRLADGLYEILWREEQVLFGGGAQAGCDGFDDDDGDGARHRVTAELDYEELASLASIPDRAGHALYSLTGAASRPELERWKRGDAHLN